MDNTVLDSTNSSQRYIAIENTVTESVNSLQPDIQPIKEIFLFNQFDPPELMTSYEPNILSQSQQEKLNNLKLQNIKNDYQYLREYPEINALISFILQETFVNKPINIKRHLREMFQDPQIKMKIMQYGLKKKYKHTDDNNETIKDFGYKILDESEVALSRNEEGNARKAFDTRIFECIKRDGVYVKDKSHNPYGWCDGKLTQSETINDVIEKSSYDINLEATFRQKQDKGVVDKHLIGSTHQTRCYNSMRKKNNELKIAKQSRAWPDPGSVDSETHQVETIASEINDHTHTFNSIISSNADWTINSGFTYVAENGDYMDFSNDSSQNDLNMSNQDFL